MKLVNSFAQWQALPVPTDSYLGLRQFNNGQCQWWLVKKTGQPLQIHDRDRLPANEFSPRQTKLLKQALKPLIADAKEARWFIGEHPWWDWSFNLLFLEDLTPDDPLNQWLEEMADKLGGIRQKGHYGRAITMMAGVMVKKLQTSPELIEPYAAYLNASAQQFTKHGLTMDRDLTARQLKATALHLLNRQWDQLQVDFRKINRWWD